MSRLLYYEVSLDGGPWRGVWAESPGEAAVQEAAEEWSLPVGGVQRCTVRRYGVPRSECVVLVKVEADGAYFGATSAEVLKVLP